MERRPGPVRRGEEPPAAPGRPPGIRVVGLSVWYGTARALRGISLEVAPGEILALVGPSGCGKSTLLRCLNRLHDLNPAVRVAGRVLLDGEDIYARGVDPAAVRRRVGMVMQRPVPLPGSIADNVTFGPRLWGIRDPERLQAIAERALRRAGLWDEVRRRLGRPASDLSGGQQQRLCLARALALEPEVLLLDEPTSALDPSSAGLLERLLAGLRGRHTLVLVTHDLDQARRLADRVALLIGGELVECADTVRFFERPADPRTVRFLAAAGRLREESD
ncbi:phosphate ABC transporter ATP-binding protein [Caldinitratiruptor microaerophilus]|uniref:Phosphate import ATP-binding protein PstB n=1 Tax=Caldinitratiruptor microaerophilus TaxID=671077 RepID=A0AA35G6M9_9FIRM|nr:phosphate ABC transporter ATP-binding protein [Caldinitratiruptor microaerophilus]BDG61591.1 phosphate import ATP-binding protein PstB [Caldinitratiruptor microaerophilus]